MIRKSWTSPVTTEAQTAHVLVVDDDPTIRELLTELLTDEGLDVTAVPDGAEAVAQLGVGAVDLVLLDAGMPVLDGFQTSVRIRDLSTTSTVPILMITGHQDDASVERAFACGANDVLFKPLHLTLLLARVCHLLQAHQNQQALRASEIRYRSIVETAQEGIWLFDDSWKTTYVNGRMAEMLGMRSEEMVGRAAADFFDAAAWQDVADWWRRRQNGATAQHDVRLRRADGSTLWAIVTASPLRTEDGGVRGTLGMVTDITARREAEDRLRESEAGLAEAQRIAHLGNWAWHIPSDTFTMSDEVRTIFGLPTDLSDVTFAMLIDQIHPEDRAMVDEVLADTLRNHSTFDVDHRIIQPDGAIRAVAARGRLALDAQNRPERLVGSIQDVTERKRAEEALAASEEYLRALVEHSADVITVLNDDGSVRYTSPAQKRLLGEANFGPGTSILDQVHPDDVAPVQALFAEVHATPDAVVTAEVRLRHSDGSWPVVEATATNLLANPAVRGIIVNSRDVTERKRIAENMAFLAEASRLLATSLDYEVTLSSVAHLATEYIADWCVVHILGSDGRTIHPLAVEHGDPAKVTQARRLQQLYPPDPEAVHGVANVLRTGRSELHTDISVTSFAADAEHDERLQLMRAVGLRSVMVVPLLVHGQTLGAISFVSSDGRRRYDQSALELAEELGRRAAQAIDNAHHYRLARDEIAERERAEAALQALNAELEERVRERTTALEYANAELRVEIGERQRAEQALRASEQRYRSLLDLAPDGIIVFDQSMHCVEANPRAAEMLGYSMEELRTVEPAQILMPPEPTEGLPPLVTLPPGASRTSERVLRRKDGTTFPAEINSVVLPGKMMQSIVRDITARAAAAEQLRQAKADAEQANQAKSEFLSRMSHELRTPLNAILGFAQLLDMGSLTSRQHDGVSQILKGGHHLLALINEVLDISRIDAGHLQLSLEPVALGDLLQEALDLIYPLATRRRVTIELPADTHEHYILADRQRMTQVLLNLLSNAIKYNHEGGVVTVGYESTTKGHLCLRVEDTGPGIAPEQLPKLFTPFERLGAERSGVEGTGLGLALSRRLVEAMGGEMGVRSTLGQGSVFWVVMQSGEHPASMLGDDHAGGASSEIDPGLHHTILYIEDNLSNLRLLEHIMAEWPGIRLLSAMQGAIGLDFAREHRPDLVLLDLHLPDLPGEHVLARLRADPATSSIPVIVLSADAQPRRMERLIAAGARSYLTKPLDIRTFRQTLKDVLIPGDC